MKKYSDLITGSIGLVIGIALLIMSLDIGAKENNVIGAAFLPEIVAVITIALSGKLAYDGYRSSKIYEEKPEAFRKNYIGVGIVMVACIVYAQLLKPVGFIPTSMVFLFLTICLMSKKEETNYLKFAIITVVTVLAIYFVFTKFFGIRLPKGILSGIL